MKPKIRFMGSDCGSGYFTPELVVLVEPKKATPQHIEYITDPFKKPTRKNGGGLTHKEVKNLIAILQSAVKRYESIKKNKGE